MKGVFINGSSGEGYMLTDEERMKLAERWMEVAPDGFKVIVRGELLRKVKPDAGGTCPENRSLGNWCNGTSFPENRTNRRIGKSTAKKSLPEHQKLPFYYYHIPAFNGAFLSMLAFPKAVENRIPNFTGIKYTFESLYEYNQCRLYKDGKFDMLHGQDETILPCLAMGGAQGGIGGTTNYNGINLVGIIDAWKAGELEQARELQNFSGK